MNNKNYNYSESNGNNITKPRITKNNINALNLQNNIKSMNDGIIM